MPQSLATINVHLIFSTKHREPRITDAIRPTLHDYLGGILRDLESPSVEINSIEDHIHLLFRLSRTHPLSDVVGQLKQSSSHWIKKHGPQFAEFYWQAGYGAFSVSQSNIEAVRHYSRQEREHHRHRSFQEEFREFLRRHDVEFDERYVWD